MSRITPDTKRPTIRLGTERGPPSIPVLDVRLGPWAYDHPIRYSNYNYVFLPPEESAFRPVPNFSDTENIVPIPKEWIGKKLIRRGKPANQYQVSEEKITAPYIIVGPNEVTGDYISGRLSIYVNYDDIIENIRYG
jgi:hypothetical protein